MDLVHEFGFTGRLRPPVPIGDGPFGTRMIFNALGGTVTGDRISGTLQEGGGDWPLIAGDGYARLDVRITIETTDGALIFGSYLGLLELTEAALAGLTAGASGTEYDDQYFRTAPRLETGDERYDWVNRTMFVARGRVRPGFTVEYEVFRVT